MPIVPVLRFPIPTHAGKRQVPEIDGSQGGFIGLVVALSVLIVVCCAAVFYLLRHHEPTDQDRAIRRERYPRTREERANDSSTMSPSAHFPGLNGLKDKFKRMWNNNDDQDESGGGGGGFGRRGGRGWIRAGSGDEWESDSDRGDPQVGRPAIIGIGRGAQLKSLSRPGTGVEDNVRIVESPLSDTGSGFIPAHYNDPFSKESPAPTTHIVSPLKVDLGLSQSPLSSNSPREATSTDDESHDTHAPDHRHRSTLSNPSVWTPTGSKFVEDI